MTQKLISIKIYDYVFKLNEARIELQEYTGVRLDRAYTIDKNEFEKNFNQYTDFHSFHSDLLNKWDIFQFVMKKIFQIQILYK